MTGGLVGGNVSGDTVGILNVGFFVGVVVGGVCGFIVGDMVGVVGELDGRVVGTDVEGALEGNIVGVLVKQHVVLQRLFNSGRTHSPSFFTGSHEYKSAGIGLPVCLHKVAVGLDGIAVGISDAGAFEGKEFDGDFEGFFVG